MLMSLERKQLNQSSYFANNIFHQETERSSEALVSTSINIR